MTRHSLMPVVQMPEATAPAAVVPDERMPVERMPAGATTVAVKTPVKADQGMIDIHAGLQRPAHLGHLGQIEMQGQSTDISIGTTTMTTAPTPAMLDTTGITRSRVPVLWRKGWARVSSRPTTRATTSTGSMTKMSWTAKVLQVWHASGLRS